MAANSFSNNRFILFFASWWFLWSALHCYVLSSYTLSTTTIIADSLVNNALIAAACLVISNNMKYYLPRQERYWYILIISLVLSFIAVTLARWILWFVFRKDEAYMVLLPQSMSIRFVVSFLLIGCMAVMSLLWYTLKEQKQMEQRKTEAEKMVRDAELFRLRQQLQPHFLFNSLNSISALTGSKPEEARHMIQQLSDFLRGTLTKEEQQWGSLQEELQYLQLYLDIEKVRFGHRLQTIIKCEEATNTMQLPSLLLQPVVENAIKFGLYDTIEEVTIIITTQAHENNLVIYVQNPFDADTATTLYGTGFGLASIQRRLFLLFARHDLLKTSATENIFTTTLIIPQLTQL